MSRTVILHTGALALVFLFSALGLRQAQAQSSSLVVLDKNKAAVSRLTDGDSIQLRVKLQSRVAQQARVVFVLEQATTPVADRIAGHTEPRQIPLWSQIIGPCLVIRKKTMHHHNRAWSD